MTGRSRSRSASDDDDLIRRNPRRGAHSKSNSAEDQDDEEMVDHMDVDEESEEEPQDDNPASEDDSEDLPIRRMSARRQKGKASKTSAASNQPTNNSRRSSRSNKFRSCMKEQPDSVRDLFAGTTKATNSRVARRKPSDDDSSSDDDDEVPARRRKQQSKKKNEPKSPARRHARARKTAKADMSGTSDEESSEGEWDSSDDDEDDEEMKIQRILASRLETKAKWREICKKMNSSEVTDGSRWFQQDKTADDDEVIEERFLVKWANLSYLHVSWETQADLFDQIEGAKTYFTTFFRKADSGILFTADERKDGDYFDPGYVQIDRILDIDFDGKIPKTPEAEDKATLDDFGIVTDTSSADKFKQGVGRQILVKWESLNYSEASYEFERDLILADIEYKDKLKEFYTRSKKPTKATQKSTAKSAEEEFRRVYKIFGDKFNKGEEARNRDVEQYQKTLADRVFKNGGQLRDYQAEGVSWFLSNYINNRSCILADEMGLGKTLQTAAFCSIILREMHRPGPFLVVVPLSTLSHWQREFTNWTGMNTMVYHGSAEDRKQMREQEFAYIQDRPSSVGANALYLKKCAGRGPGPWMAEVVITTPEIMVADDWQELSSVNWEILIVDEAHRMKNQNSKLALNLRKDSFKFKHKILLTGTPIQNDVKEFWTLMNFIDPENFDDQEDFLEQYGDIKSKDRIDELHEQIRPYILRRLKEDVEKSVPPKKETLIEVELTVMQKKYYRALYEKNVGFLHKNKKALDGPSLNNLAMQLRKCCNHLFLLNGAEEELRNENPDEKLAEAEFLSRGSGKLVLLDKLLPRLKEGGNRVLIFSQFKIMLDILEDYLAAHNMKYERIDGSITGQKRQRAIDRYQDPTSDDPPFVMLLSTRAGGVGINLTSADTCIIFDSDWNPQNDLQAQARCHRIGQTKDVRVYRLLTKKTYEMQMFHMSSLKMGLDQAVLKGFENGASGEANMTKDEVEKLLRHGAYDIFNEDKSGATEAESNDFVQLDIDAILERSKTVTHDNTGSKSNAAGSTFSKASFVAPKAASGAANQPTEDVDIEDPDFWTKIVGEAPAKVQPEVKPRVRNKVIYDEKLIHRQMGAAFDPDASGSSDSEDEFSSSDEEGRSPGKPKERSRWGGQQAIHWKRAQAETVLSCIDRYGYCDGDSLISKLPSTFSKFSKEEIHRMSWSIILLSICEAAKDEAAATKRRADRAAERKLEEMEKEGDVTQEKMQEALKSNPEDVSAAFSKLWKMNANCNKKSLKDAISYAHENEPRSSKPNDEVVKDEAERLFYQSLWSSLQGRGWKEETSSTGKAFRYGEQRFESPNAAMNAVPRIHPELQNMVVPLLQSIEEFRVKAGEKDAEKRKVELSLNEQNINFQSLNDFLLRYAPLQLVATRGSSRRLNIGRRVITSCSYMDSVNMLMTAASAPNMTLSNLIVVDGRAALPHPLWSADHDATLLRAIAKHGWIDRDKSCKAIIQDPEIKWGHPFEAIEVTPNQEPSKEDSAKLKATAQRAATFMEENHEMIEHMKGCSRHILVESYGLKHGSSDGSDQDKITWVVDDAMLMQASSATGDKSEVQDPLDLPVKKDMTKRAKVLLSKSVASLESGRAGGSNLLASKSGDKAVNDHGYAVIDQGDRCCILLAEMVKGITKGSYKGSVKNMRMLCALAYQEAMALKDMFAADSKEKASEMQKIANQIALGKKTFPTAALSAKNLFRVMVGQDPTPTRSEDMFPMETSASKGANIGGNKSSGKQKPQPKKEPARRDDGSTGEKAITRALKKAFDKVGESPCMFTAEDDPQVGLQLTMIEMLILYALCTEGIPLSKSISSQADTKLEAWNQIGSVLEIAAKDCYQISKEKVEKSRNVLKRFQHQEESDAKTLAATKVAATEFDEATKEEASQQALEYASNPDKLAKKSIMLVEKVRQFGFSGFNPNPKTAHKQENGLGTKVPDWLSKELSKLAEEFDVVDGSGKPMSFTTTDCFPECSNTTVAGYLDKKSSRQVVSQIALLCRLKAVCLNNSEENLRSKTTKAIKCSRKMNDVWEKQPEWWDDSSVDHTVLLLQRLHEHGFLHVLGDGSGFFDPPLASLVRVTSAPSLRELGLTKVVVQQKANQIIRELHQIEETEEAIRLLDERRAAKKQPAYDKTLAECHTKASSGSKKKNGKIQTGLRSFFVATKSNSKKSKVVMMEEEPTDESSPDSTGKRKEPASSDEDTPTGKKAKKGNPGDDGSEASTDSVEKTIRTVVNENGVIELVSVPKH